MVFILDADDSDAPVPEWAGLRILDEAKHKELEELTEEFLARGGKITQLPGEVVGPSREARKRMFNPGPSNANL